MNKLSIKKGLKRVTNKKYKRILLFFIGVLLFNFVINVTTGVNLIEKSVKSVLNSLHIYTEEIQSIILKTDGYDSIEGGNARIIKSAEWIGARSAKIKLELDTLAALPDGSVATDIGVDAIFVVDTSGSMSGTKLTQVKNDTISLANELLENSNNRVALIDFNTTATLRSNFINNKTTFSTAVNRLVATGGTDYTQAYKQVGTLLNSYVPDDNRDLIMLFLTDGFPGSTGHKTEYVYLKQKYPDMIINGIQYELGRAIIQDVIDMSDYQYLANSANLYDTLFDVYENSSSGMAQKRYQKYQYFNIEDIISDDFEIEAENDIKVNLGEVQIDEVNGKQKLIWSFGEDSFKSGSKAMMEITVKYKGETNKRGFFPTNDELSLSYKLPSNKKDTNKSTTETPVLKNGYEVTYETNLPDSKCKGVAPESEIHFAMESIVKSDVKLSCDGYIFQGWEITDETANEVKKINDDTFVMPNHDVKLRGMWSNLAISKSMEGEITEKSQKLYDMMAAESVLDNKASKNVNSPTGIDFSAISSETNGTGVYTLSSTAGEKYPVHYYRGEVNNNVIYGNFCWKIIRTTNTGGVKLIYNGVPNATTGQCNNTYTNTQIGTSKFQEDYTKSEYNSVARETVDTWYENNIAKLENYLEDTEFCADASSEVPTTNCSNIYSVKNSKLTHPVALLNSTEAILAGAGAEDNKNYYLYSGQAVWTMSEGNKDFTRQATGYQYAYANTNHNQGWTGEYTGQMASFGVWSLTANGQIIEFDNGSLYGDTIPITQCHMQSGGLQFCAGTYSYSGSDAYRKCNAYRSTSCCTASSGTTGWTVYWDYGPFCSANSYIGGGMTTTYTGNINGSVFGLRPVISLKNDSFVVEGDGTKETPYVVSSGNDKTLKKIFNSAVIDNQSSNFVESETGIDFSLESSDTNGKGAYIRSGTENDTNPIYYFRGNEVDNNVIFVNACWKILRTTETGGIKLIYNGVPANGVCNNTGTKSQISTSYFNSPANEEKYIGYMRDGVDSNIKTVIDAWYMTNIKEPGYSKYLEDTVWCNDKSISSEEGMYTYYGAYGRNNVNFNPAVKDQDACPSEEDRYTVSTKNGNGALRYPIGLITADELTLAGNGLTGSNTTFLYTGQNIWTMSPYQYYVNGTSKTVYMYGYNTNSIGVSAQTSYGVRPVISLKAGTKIARGVGSTIKPYVIEAIPDETGIFEDAVLDNEKSSYVSSENGINFELAPSDTNGKGLYIKSGTENDDNPIYYYRGAVGNNHVLFANLCWKIVRSTETGGIKLVYNGKPKDGVCNNTGTNAQISASYFNNPANDSKYVGFTFDDSNINSTLKWNLDVWYSENIEQEGFAKYLEDAVWCNDKSISSVSGVNTFYGAYGRNFVATTPALKNEEACPNREDRYTVNSSNGNGKLKYPVGLLTADEATYAGLGYKGYSTTSYLYTGQNIWTMSPFSSTTTASQMFRIYSNLAGATSATSYGIRPSISLKKGIIIEKGKGTSTNPYVIEAEPENSRPFANAELDNKSSYFVTSKTGIDFGVAPSNTNGQGAYILHGTENDTNPIKYYRGIVKNNNLIFANYCWKIVRTTETGGTKLIFNGVPSDGVCNNTGTNAQIPTTSYFNTPSNDAKYIGYMFDEDKINSTIKNVIDTWYLDNISNKGFSSYLEDTVWCNDRSEDSTNGNYIYNGAYARNFAAISPALRNSEACPNKVDRFTVNDITNGNGKLTYPVGLLTADEVTMAGSGYKGYSNSAYLYTGQYNWTMSPYNLYGTTTKTSYVFRMSGNLLGSTANTSSGVRPSISLKKEINYLYGTGTATNPYVVDAEAKIIKPFTDAKVDKKRSNFVNSDTGIDFSVAPSVTNGQGAYILSGTENDTHPIKYYRGTVTNNNVLFAEMCWKIVRTTETGGLKLVYNGKPTDGTCNNTGTNSQLATLSTFNANKNEAKYIGYTYDTINTDSTIKEAIDPWYKENIEDKGYSKYLEDAVWCNDKSISSTSGYYTYYGAYARNFTDFTPTLKDTETCPNKEDRYTVSDTTRGNGKLKYPVGLLTADEATIAGNGYKGYSTVAYLYTGQYTWLMSPYYFYNINNVNSNTAYMFRLYSNLSGVGVNTSTGIRPAISLKENIDIINGNGTVDNPFIIDTVN